MRMGGKQAKLSDGELGFWSLEGSWRGRGKKGWTKDWMNGGIDGRTPQAARAYYTRTWSVVSGGDNATSFFWSPFSRFSICDKQAS
jgi:hypothetical protein